MEGEFISPSFFIVEDKMRYKVTCLVDASVSCEARLDLSKRVSLPRISFSKKGQKVIFSSAKDFEPYARGFNGLANIGKVSVVQVTNEQSEAKVEAKLGLNPEVKAKVEAEEMANDKDKLEAEEKAKEAAEKSMLAKEAALQAKQEAKSKVEADKKIKAEAAAKAKADAAEKAKLESKSA